MTEQSVAEPVALSAPETQRVRRRVRLVVEITSRVGAYRAGLALAARRLTPSEAAIIADLERNGLDVPQLREVLCGAHVLVDDPNLYDRWRFPKSYFRFSWCSFLGRATAAACSGPRTYVYVTEAPSPAARALLAEVRAAQPGWSLPPAGRTAPATLRAGEREVRCAVRRVPVAEQAERT